MGCAWALAAGEPVKFSDTAGRGVGSALESMTRQREVITPDQSSRPSLQGITAGPFAPTTSSPALNSLTAKERDLLDRRRNWLFYSNEQLRQTDQSVQRALGVRLADDGLTRGETPDGLPRTAMERYVLDANGDRPPDAGVIPGAERSTLTPLPRPLDSGDSRSPVFGGADILRGASSTLRTETLSLGTYSLEELIEGARANRAATRQSTLNLGLQPSTRLGERNGLADPGESSVLGMSEMSLTAPYEKAVGPRISEILDPINTYPDKTREALNPVVGSAQPNGSMDPLFSDRRPSNAQLGPLGRAAALDLQSRPNAGLLGPVMGSTEERGPKTSALKAMPLRLDIPGRSF